MRIFIGIRPTDEFRAALSVLQNHLRTFGVTGRYLDPSNLHMTLAFIGEWPDDAVLLLPRVVHPFSLALSRPGVFPKAKVLWAGVDPSEPLEYLAGQVRQFLDEHEIPYDPKPFFAYHSGQETFRSRGSCAFRNPDSGRFHAGEKSLPVPVAAGRKRHGIHRHQKQPVREAGFGIIPSSMQKAPDHHDPASFA